MASCYVNRSELAAWELQMYDGSFRRISNHSTVSRIALDPGLLGAYEILMSDPLSPDLLQKMHAKANNIHR
jgi:hypothetical protein